jgi:A/G-specific adenine glycosylase
MKKNIVHIEAAVARLLLAWYKKNKRPLPWRETRDPYRIWISEIMLQQTQVDTVIPYYRRFLTTFPDVKALAEATLEEVLKVWENMGYYSRARHLHSAARMIVATFGGRIPDSWVEIRSLPGIGAYTAGAILSIAYGQAVPAVDGNARRILSRLLAVRDPLDSPQIQKQLHLAAAALVPSKNPGDFNQALMDLGATICKAKAPECARCPISRSCRARKLEWQAVLPIMKKRPPLPHRQAAAAVIRNERGDILIVQRPATGLLASLWKFPGDFIPSADSAIEALPIRIREELGIRVRIRRHLATVDHAYTHFRITLHAYDSQLSRGTPQAIGCQNWRWIRPEDVKGLPFSKIDRMIMQAALP